MPNHDPDEQWHLSKAVPISLIIVLVAQTIALIIWAVRLDARVGHLEETQLLQDQRLSKTDDINAKIAVIDERQRNVLTRLDIQTKTMQEILSIVAKIQIQKQP